ncbi:unnamed protein product [Heligmosomoides polygyrus]|uniref:HTH_48 domain-containing protein n=1 Tax=Heligmosomoides polygyrus TaxID=6339 RepID=A0A183FG90_HELPZ|nr:unnamed protein product [Heligmosomoides polygyrus]
MSKQFIPTETHILHVMLFLHQSGLNANESYRRLKDVYNERAPARSSLHVKKVMLCIWWSVLGVEYWELLDEGITRAQWVDATGEAEDVPKPDLHVKKVMRCGLTQLERQRTFRNPTFT